MKKLMILGASILQLPAIKKAKEMGYQVVAVDMDSDAIGFNEDGVIKEVISTIDIPAVIESAERNKIDGVMTLASDMPMQTVAAVAEKLHLIGIDSDTAFKATNKAAMRAALKAAGVPIPKYYRVTSEKEFITVSADFEKSYVVKPADSSGSRGIFLVEASEKENGLNAYKYSREFSRSGEVVVEEYMQGREVSVESISIDGEVNIIQITDKITTGAPHFVEMGHTQPANFDIYTLNRIKSVAKAAINSVGIKNGPSHTEIIVTEEGPKIVELGARLGGDCITTHLVPLSTGVDMVEASIKIAMGEKPDITPKFNHGSAIRYFEQHQGILCCVTGIEKAEEIEGIKQISIVKKPGEKITDIVSSGSRIGFIIAEADTAEIAVEQCRKGIREITVSIE